MDNSVREQIDNIAQDCKETKPLVAIRCITYNHEPYIRDALEGFVMQKTDFPFVAIVHDDASTDSTAVIIREYAEKYPDIIKPIYETENQYSKRDGSLQKIMKEACEASGAKYIAMCEGDDYWIDPLKLHKQVDFLESHPDFGMVYSDFNIYIESKKKSYNSIFKNYPIQFPKEYNDVSSFILKKGYVAPPSWLFRKDLLSFPSIGSLDGTFVMFANFLVKTKVFAFDEAMVTYRILPESASHSKQIDFIFRRELNIMETQKKMIDIYNLNPKIKSLCEENYYKQILNLAMLHHKREIVESSRRYLLPKYPKYRIKFFSYDYLAPLISPILTILDILTKITKFGKNKTLRID